MGVSKYDIKETDFDRSKSDQYELSILLGMGSFTYIVRELRTFRLLAFRSMLMESASLKDWVPHLQRTVQEDDLLRPNLIKKVYLSYISDRVTVVPNRLFSAGKEAEYLGQLTDIGLDDRCRSEALPELGAHLVYAIGEERLEATTRRFSPLKTRHVASRLLLQWRNLNLQLGPKAIYSCVRDQQLIVAGIQSGRLLFFNIFQFSSAQDALYYIILAYQQCGWAPNRIPLYLCGEIISDSEVYRQLYRFVEDIRFLEFDGGVELGPLLRNIPGHLYYDLLCQL